MSDVLNGDLISEAEVAQILSVHYKTLRRWHRERRAPKRIRIGQKIYYRKSSVARWLEKNEQECDFRLGAAS